ncbi:hypothetical protein ACFE04_030729 [Oxalis oulophora]
MVIQRRRVMTWRRAAESLQGIVAHALLFSFTLFLSLKLDRSLPRPWWFVFAPLWLFHAVVTRGRFSLPAPSMPHDRHWAPWHAVMGTPLLVAFELLLCIRLEARYVVSLKIVFLPLLALEIAILIDNIRMCRALMPGDEESMSDEAIWETLPHFWVAISMVFFIAGTTFTLLKLSGDVAALGWWDLFINFGIAECFAFLVCTKWHNPAIHRHTLTGESSSSSMAIRYLDWNRGLISADEDRDNNRICNLQDIGGHIMKIPFIIFQVLLFMRLEGTPPGAKNIPFTVLFTPILLLQGAGVMFAMYRLVEKIAVLLRGGADLGRHFAVLSRAQYCFGFLQRGSRLLGWWSIDEGSREEQARLYCADVSGYNTFSPDTVKKMPKADLVEEIWRLQALLGEQTEITNYSQQEYERLQNEKILCRVCFEEQINTVLLPCRHHVLCSTCSDKCKKCPICRVSIEKRLPSLCLVKSLPKQRKQNLVQLIFSSMAGTSWILDKNRIATKIKSASGSRDLQQKWKSNPTKSCPKCQYVIDNSDVTQEWPGLPRGVKFDPSDQEIIWHLLTKVGVENSKPHPFIDEFIPTVENEEGICVKQDGTVSHFFHRAIKAYNTGTRKRRKIHGDDSGDVRWHKTGRTKPISLDGAQRGSKKIMVLYVNLVKGGKNEKTNWVMHQYHLGIGEDENEGEYVISKIFYQQQAKLGEKSPMIDDTPKKMELGDKSELDSPSAVVDTSKVDPVTPKSATPDPPCPERRFSHFDQGQGPATCTDDFAQSQRYYMKDSDLCFYHLSFLKLTQIGQVTEEVQPELDLSYNGNQQDNDGNEMVDNNDDHLSFLKLTQIGQVTEEVQPELDLSYNGNQQDNDGNEMVDNNDDHAEEEPKWWESESQNLLNSQQLVEGLAMCADLLQSQSPNREGNENEKKSCLADYTELGAEHLKKDLEECQKLDRDLSNIPTDTPPEFRLSQLEFNSEDSFLAWGADKSLD